MSTSDRSSREDGFTLTEILIAMALLTIVMLAALPALLSVVKSGAVVRDQTRAKNLTQQRLEQLRDLSLHVDRQNGPFLDLLDIYYTHSLTGSPATVVNSGGVTLSGVYVPSGSPAVADEPTAPYFRVTTGALPGSAGFLQTVTAQFLSSNGSVVPATRFEGTAAGTTGYTSQVAGRDEPPALMLEMTVKTTWTQAGASKKLISKTRIADGRPERPLIQSQARAVALDLTSTAIDGSTLELQAGVTTLDGAQSNVSSVAGYATGAVATRTGQAAVTGQVTSFNLPGTAAETTGSSASVSPSSCGWYAFGVSGTTNATGDVSAGLPKAPADVDANTPPRTVKASLRANGSAPCGVLSYDNLVSGGLPRLPLDTVGQAMGPAPYAKIENPSGSGDVVRAEGYVLSNALTSTPQRTASGAAMAMTQPLVLFPGSPGLLGQGLVQVSVLSAKVDCSSGTGGGNGSATGSYDGLSLRWWGVSPGETLARYHSATWDYNGSGVPTLRTGSETWNPGSTFVPRWNGLSFDNSLAVPLSSFVTLAVPSATEGVVSESATSGQRGFVNGIMTVRTASTMSNEAVPGYSSIKAQVGQLSCVADDER